jgi:hypothetical protein
MRASFSRWLRAIPAKAVQSNRSVVPKLQINLRERSYQGKGFTPALGRRAKNLTPNPFTRGKGNRFGGHSELGKILSLTRRSKTSVGRVFCDTSPRGRGQEGAGRGQNLESRAEKALYKDRHLRSSPLQGEGKNQLARLCTAFLNTGFRGHPCRRKFETREGFHVQSSDLPLGRALTRGGGGWRIIRNGTNYC